MKWFSGFALVLLAWLIAVAAWIAIGPPEDTVAASEMDQVGQGNAALLTRMETRRAALSALLDITEVD